MFNTVNNIILSVFNAQALPEAQQKEILRTYGPILFEGVLERSMEKMEETDKKAFENLLLQNKGPEPILTFLSTRIANITEIVNEEAEKVRDENKNKPSIS